MKRCVVVVVLVVACAGTVRAQEAKPAVSVEAIQAAWKARQDKLKTVRVAWTEKRRLPKGMLSHEWSQTVDARRLKLMNPGNDTIPPQDTEHVLGGKVEIAGSDVALDLRWFDWDAEKKQFVPMPIRVVFDGKTQRLVIPEGGKTAWGQATVTNRKVLTWAKQPHCRPVFQFVRGVDPALVSWSPNEVRATGRASVIDGVNCVEVEGKGGSVVTRYWVAPERDYALVRQAIVRGAEVLQQITMTFESDTKLGWKLAGWRTMTSHFGGKFVEHSVATVDSFTWGGPPSPKAFDSTIPRGSRVTDETLPNGQQEYILRPEGGKRVIHNSEIGKSYEEFLQSTCKHSVNPSGGLA